jgi:hypothetical protein
MSDIARTPLTTSKAAMIRISVATLDMSR